MCVPAQLGAAKSLLIAALRAAGAPPQFPRHTLHTQQGATSERNIYAGHRNSPTQRAWYKVPCGAAHFELGYDGPRWHRGPFLFKIIQSHAQK